MVTQPRQERDYVDECPSCGARFVGMSPEEYRERHPEECPAGRLVELFHFSEGDSQ